MYSHIFAMDFAWSRNYPLMSKGDAHHAMDDLFHQYGIPETLVSDDAKELTLGAFVKKPIKLGVIYRSQIPIAHGKIERRARCSR